MKTAINLGMALWLISSSMAAQSALVGTVQEPGLNVTNIETSAGKVSVYLPQNIGAGDRISGTVSAQPNGKTEKETAKNQAYLQGCVLELEDRAATKSKLGILSFVAPTLGSSLFAVLRDDKGKSVARFPIPVQAPSFKPTGSSAFKLPELGQVGTALPIPGPTDGDLTNSVVKIGDQFYQPIAESPSGMVVRPANDASTGVQNIQVRDGNQTSEGKIRMVAIQLNAARLNLQRNEMTSLQVKVSGLSGLAEPLSLHLRNETPGNVRLANGNIQDLDIEPSKVKVDGTFEVSDIIHGFGLGSFLILATVTLKERSLNCGESRDIYTNFTGKAIVVTVDAKDDCLRGDSTLNLDDKRKVIIPDGGANAATFTLAHGEKITLECKGAGDGKCSYTVNIH